MTITPLSTPLASALAYRARGWSLIPVQRREKKPFVAWKHHQSTLPTNEEIERWWSQYPDANIGIVTGRISDLIVVDIDTGADISGLHLPSTYTVRSGGGGGGGGCHMYYRYPQSFEGHIETKAGIREHIDIRADGGLIVAPPSLHASGKHYIVDESCPSIDEIAEAPEWILEECMKGEKMGKQDTKTKKESKKEDSKKTKSKTDWKAFLKEKNGEGTRNDRTTKYAGKLASELSPDLQDIVGWTELDRYNQSNNLPPLDEKELSGIWESVCHMVDNNTPPEKPSQPEKIITYLGDDTIFFLDEVNNPYALVHFEDHAETMPISSKIFRLLLSKRYYDETGRAPNHESLAQALSICEGKAYFGKTRHPLDIRVARRENTFLYDLCDDTWQYVEIRPDGWSTHRHHEPIFRRYTQMQVQILPTQSDTSPFRIFDFLNVKEDKKLLVLVYILSLFIADMPHPVLIVHGSRWSAKSTFGKIIKKFVDPSVPDTIALPHTKDDLIRILNQSWYQIFDNISQISDDCSDTFCRAVTGEGYIKRALYTDDGNVVYHYKRGICLNGIDIVSNRPDLLDRSIIVELERISRDDRKSEEDFWKDFEIIRPALLGSFFDTLSKALRILPTIRPKQSYRMADFTKVGIAITIALGYTEEDFHRVYTADIDNQNQTVVDNDLVASTIVAFMEKRQAWIGTMSGLYANLLSIAENSRQDRSFPKSPQTLSRRINAVMVNLREIGLHIKFLKDTDGVRGRGVAISREIASNVSFSSQTSLQSYETCDVMCDANTLSNNIPTHIATHHTPDTKANIQNCDAKDAISRDLAELADVDFARELFSSP